MTSASSDTRPANASSDADLVVIGGGMAGGLLAALLADSGLQITLLDAGPEPVMPVGEPGLRVSAITEASRNMLQRAGAWQRLPEQRRCAYTSMDVWDADGTGRVGFHATDAGAAQLGWIIENELIVAALYQSCAEKPNVDWRTAVPVEQVKKLADGWQVSLTSGATLRAPMLVGADGANSMVRQAAGIPASPRDSGHVAIVACIESEQQHADCARQRFIESGPLALLPLYGDGHQLSIVWSLWPRAAEPLMKLGDDDFSRALTDASEACLGKLRLLSKRVVFPVRELHASDYVRSGMALIGDAAHVVHPLAGQGINLGLLDAGVLAEEMLAARERGLPFHHDAALKRYQRRRRGHNLLMQNAMRGFKLLFEQRSPLLRFVRNSGLSMVNDVAPLKGMFARQALGRGGDLPLTAKMEMS